jgi:hypothetical protein
MVSPIGTATADYSPKPQVIPIAAEPLARSFSEHHHVPRRQHFDGKSEQGSNQAILRTGF